MNRRVEVGVRQGLAFGETGIERVPEAHAVLAALPAEKNFLSVQFAGEIYQAFLDIFKDPAELGDLVDVILNGIKEKIHLNVIWMVR